MEENKKLEKQIKEMIERRETENTAFKKLLEGLSKSSPLKENKNSKKNKK